jgi:hypothetical protein
VPCNRNCDQIAGGDVVTVPVSTFAACTNIQGLAVTGHAVLAVCAPPGRITLVDLSTGRSWTGDGGGFPDSVVTAPS